MIACCHCPDIVECRRRRVIGTSADGGAGKPQFGVVASTAGFSAARNSGLTDPSSEPGDHDVAMSYAVVWNTNSGPDCIGKLELFPGTIQLLGVGAGLADVDIELCLDDLDCMFLERCAPPKNSWEPALVLVTRNGDRIAIGSLEGLGALHELAESVEHGRQHVAA